MLRALRAVAGDYAVEELDPSHWIAVPPGAEPDERVDLLFATGDPEESAIELAVRKKCGSVLAPVFPVDILVACKFLAERDDAKDWLDIYALHRRGAYDIRDVVRRLRQMGLREDGERFVAFMASLEEMSRKKRERK